ncbi:MAG: hypothetical protein FWF84_00165, partial [Kiritimatiellaeota bacterium]|nr:hypothetical protein [Kiritimatiellota bacterium]
NAATYYVDPGYTGANGVSDGSESRPYLTIGEGVAAANGSAANVVKVAEGTYSSLLNGGAEDFGTDGIDLKCNVYGGYAGWDGIGWDDARVAGSTVIDLDGAGTRAFYMNGVNATLTFDGLTIRNANHALDGGVIHSVDGIVGGMGVRLAGCVFSNNVTTGSGGIVQGYAYGASHAGIFDCVFVDNVASNGGAVYMQVGYSTYRVEDSIFSGNVATAVGGCAFIGNQLSVHPTVIFERCRFTDNTAAYAGVVSVSEASTTPLTFSQCVFTGNACTVATGGAVIGAQDYYWSGNCRLVNCLVTGSVGGYALQANSGRTDGYGIASVLTLQHCTVADNLDGGINASLALTVQNSLIVSNGDEGIRFSGAAERCVVTHTDIYGHVADTVNVALGAGCRSEDPLFVDAPLNYRLAEGSPCIGAGVDVGVAVDMNNNMRPSSEGFSLGCYELVIPAKLVLLPSFATATSATLRAVFSYIPPSSEESAFFVVDTVPGLGESVGAWWKVSDMVDPCEEGVIFSVEVAGLAPGTTYAYRCVTVNAEGDTWSEPMEITTLPSGTRVVTWTGAMGDGLASTDGNWDVSGIPTSADVILVDTATADMTWDAGENGLPDTVLQWIQTENYEGVVTIPTRYPDENDPTLFTTLTVMRTLALEGGTWKPYCPVNGQTEEQWRLVVAVGGDMIVDSPASIVADACGFAGGQGPGAPTAGGYRFGAGHGGVGGYSHEVNQWTRGMPPSGMAYGSAIAPESLGSGAWVSDSSAIGGGAVAVSVTGTLELRGTVSCNGGSYFYGTGSGGSIAVTAGSLFGEGTLRAHGAGNAYSSPGAAGGRIAVKLTQGDFDDFHGSFTALGGDNAASASGRGATGTVYLESADQLAGRGTLIIEEQAPFYAVGKTVGITTRLTDGEDLNAFSRIVLKNGNLGVMADNALDMGSLAHIEASGVGSATLTIHDGSGVTFPTEFAVPTAFMLCIDDALDVTGDWTVPTGAILSHSAAGFYTNEWPTAFFDVTLRGNLTVEAGGRISGDGCGYAALFGPGAGTSGNNSGGHGGTGGAGTAETPPQGLPYGDVRNPVDFGSGSQHTSGGGAIRLTVTGDVINDGIISADGLAGTSSGAGGSVMLSVDGTLTGTGSISANGNGGWVTTTGGGGRVAVFLTGAGSTFTDYAGTITATGGILYPVPSTWHTVGAAGTVYLVSAQEREKVDIANFVGAEANPYSWTTLGAAGQKELREAVVTVASGATLLLEQDMDVGDVILEAGSVLDLGSHTLRVYHSRHDLDGAVIGCGDILWIDIPTLIIVR